MDGARSVTVIGAGAMGRQISVVCALAGYRVTNYDIDAEALRRAREELAERLRRTVEKGQNDQAKVDAAFARLALSTDLAAAVSDADYVIEAAAEKLDVKRELFAAADKAAPAHAVLATNSSSIVSSRIADATGRAEQVCNLHFFNPALVMECVEVVGGPHTARATIRTSVDLIRSIGKKPVVLHREVPGFVANRILHAIRDEAVSLMESGVADLDDIDLACRAALGHPMGPFELMDLVGIDIGCDVQKDRYAESGDPRDLPADSVVRKVESGELGRKTGKGWYRYDEHGNKRPHHSS